MSLCWMVDQSMSLTLHCVGEPNYAWYNNNNCCHLMSDIKLRPVEMELALLKIESHVELTINSNWYLRSLRGILHTVVWVVNSTGLVVLLTTSKTTMNFSSASFISSLNIGISADTTVVPAAIVTSNGCVSLKSIPAWRDKYVHTTVNTMTTVVWECLRIEYNKAYGEYVITLMLQGPHSHWHTIH